MAVNPAIQAHFDKQSAFNDQLDTSVDNIVTDVKFLDDTIAKLQASASASGQFSPEDQSLIDQLDSRTDALVQKVNALDELTPPAPPALPPTP